ncbi:unnamed protein product [Rotaria magnacalcarata]|uniref:Uncharacterized protein n=7 Tax=Rotaria magnacalcarata TaxID=392030 RepID=A0A815UFG9_9BILA|nr:unnamed protein product [Rotaria magnacalcarata]
MFRKVHLYILRNAKSRNHFQIQAIFDNGITLDFTPRPLLAGPDGSSIFIYELQYDLKAEENNVLSIKHETTSKPVRSYQLRISWRVFTTHHFEESKQRSVEYPQVTEWHSALLDVVFEKSFMLSAPGSSVPLWNQLCLFSYFFLQHQAYDACKFIFNQFINLLSDNDLRMNQLDGFFQTSNNYISCVMNDPNRYTTDTEVLIRMIGILLINENNINISRLSLKENIPKILSEISKHCDGTIDSVSNDDSDFFENSVAKFLCLKLWLTAEFIENEKDTSSETIELIRRIRKEEKRQKVVSGILKLLVKINSRIQGSKWTELFNLVDPNQLKFEYLELIKSIDVYLKYLIKIAITTQFQNVDIQNKALELFDDFVKKDQYAIDLKSILFLLQFEQDQLRIHDRNTADLEERLRLDIRSNQKLRKKIRDYLYKTPITMDHFQSIRTIINFEPHSQLLHDFNRQNFLLESLKKNVSESSHFYCEWFSCFIANSSYSMNDDQQRQDYQQLIKQWASCFEGNRDKLDSMFTELDKLLNSFQSMPNDSELIFHVLQNGLIRVKNEYFIEKSKMKFIDTILTSVNADDLKCLNSSSNPLKRLIEISNMDNQNKTVIDLIELTLTKIPISENDIVESAIKQPMKSTLIYHVLFNKCFRKFPIYEKVIELMDTLWARWDRKEMYANDIMIWQKQTVEQRVVANQMWNTIEAIKEREQSFEVTLKLAYDELENKKSILKKTRFCVNEYCQRACDEEKLIDQIQIIEKKLMTNKVYSVVIPECIQQIQNYIDQLIPYAKCQVWQNFLKNNEDKLIPTSETHVFCDSILSRCTEVFNTFTNQIKNSCSDWRNQPISQLIKIFPNMEHDLDPLKEKLDGDVTEFFTLLFEYKKSSTDFKHICQGYLNLSDLFQIQPNDHESTLRDMLRIDENTNGATLSTVYRNFQKHFYKRNSTNISKLVSYFGKSFELIQFLDSVSASDIDNLREAVNDSDDTLMNTKATLDLVILKTFLVNIHSEIEKNKKDSLPNITLNQLIDCFESATKSDQNKSIFECFDTCCLLLSSIKQIHSSLTQRSLTKTKQISSIMQNTSFKFLHVGQQRNTKMIGCNYHYDVTISLNEHSDLRDRARLVEYFNTIQTQNNTNQSISVIHSFVSFVDTIENTIKQLTQLNMTGYPSMETSLELNKTFTCINMDFDELISFETKLGKLLADWEDQLCKLYKEHIELTYFKYQQVWSIEQHLLNRTRVSDNAYHLLKYIGIQPELIPNDIILDVKEDPINRIKNIGKILSALMCTQRVINEHEYQGNNRVLVVKTSEEGVMRAILSLFKIGGVKAQINQMFSCTEKTTWMELKAFAYRCCYSKKFHLLIRPELLPISIQDKFIELLLQIIKLDSDRRFQFGVITTTDEKNQSLINSLRTVELLHPIYDYQMLNKHDLKKETEKFIGKNCFLVTSGMAGLGKSTLIRDRIDKSGKQYLKFPISGHIDLETLTGRLHHYTNQSLSASNLAIHIDIGIILDISQLHEFLYCILLFRSFCYGLVAINLPVDVPIYIELESSPQMISLFEKLIVFEHLEKIDIPHIEWKEMNMKYLPGIQLVINYLQSIQNKVIGWEKIDEENMIALDTITCSKLLREQFNLDDDQKQISWASAKILVTIYHYLFEGFSKCEQFFPKHTKAVQLRIDILQALINSSKQFTSFSVDSIRKSQRSTGDGIIQLDKAIIRWDTLQPFTVVFTEWNDPLFVYKKTNDVPRSLIDTVVTPVQTNIFYRLIFFNSIKREQEQREQAQFPDHQQLKHADFFMRLGALSKEYYNKAVCNSCFRRYEDKDQRCTKCGDQSQLLRPKSFQVADITEFQKLIADKLKKEYVWTADNYIKALLIYLRIQCRLPVILIGETGRILKYPLIFLITGG